MKRITLFLILAMFLSCSKLMMSVKDRDESQKHICLKEGDAVSVLRPALRESVSAALKDTKWPEEKFSATLQKEIVEELKWRGVNAQADSSPEGAYILQVLVSEYNTGSGALRLLLSDSGLGDSKLEGSAVLKTPEGRRELELRKRGRKSGATEAGDQTEDNIHYFASALASKICAK